MGDRWIVSDTHFGHENSCVKFKLADGVTPLRPFANAQEMDEHMVYEWNKLVKPSDRVYHLGDVVINRRHLPTVGRCNGRKVLIKGNHDIFKLQDYLPYFDDIRSYHVSPNEGVIFSHIPIARESFERFGVNVHGHTHANSLPDPHYICVCVEQTDFKPIHWDDLMVKVNTVLADQRNV